MSMGSAREIPVERHARMPSNRGTCAHASGFTLIELMIALIVLGILTAIAYPTYTEFVRRSRIVDATSQLNDFRTRQEQAYQDNRRYDDGAGNCAIQAQMPAFNAARDNFAFTCTFNPGALGGYTLLATGNGAMGMLQFDYNLVVDPATGALTRTTVSVPASWSGPPVPNTCWQTRKGGKCS
jgi:type IV pilus assembly protein PilE